MKLYYIRHGQPIYEPDCLTETGKNQAKALSKRLKDCKIEKIFSSDSGRVLETAQPTAQALKLPIEKLHWCHECFAAEDFNPLKEEGKWTWCFEHIPTLKLFNSPEIVALGKKWYDFPAFKNLNYKKGVERVDRQADEFLSSLGYTHDRINCVYKKNENQKYQNVALFAHSGFGFAFLSSILDIPYPSFCSHFDLGLSCFVVVDFIERDDVVIPMIRTYSNDSHLYKEGLDRQY